MNEKTYLFSSILLSDHISMNTKSNSHKPYPFIAILIFVILGTWSLNAQCPTISSPTQSFCDVESLLVSDLNAIDNGGGVVWYESASSTTPLPAGTPLVDGEDYFADDLSGTCSTRPQVTVSILGPPNGQNFQGFCIDDTETVTLADLNATGNDVQWYDSPASTTPLPLTTELSDGDTFYADQLNPDTGCRTSRLTVSVTIGIVPVPTGDPLQVFCSSPSNIPTVADLVATGVNNWYPSPVSGLPLPPSTPLVNGQLYYATSIDPPCESDGRLIVLAVVIDSPDAGEDGSLDICATDSPVDLFLSLGGTPDGGGTWSPALASGTGVFDPTVDAPGVYTYTVTGTVPCPDDTAQVSVSIVPPAEAGDNGTLELCSSDSPVDLFLSLGGTPDSGGTWSPALASGTGVFDPVVDAPGVYTYTVGTGCSDSATVTVTINPGPNAGDDGALQVCDHLITYDLFNSLGGTPESGGTWSPALASGTGVFDPAVDAPGVYTYTVAGTVPCPDDTAQVSVTIFPDPDAGEDGTLELCSSDSPIDLFLSLGGTPNTGGTWSPALTSGTGVFDPAIDTAGTYTYSVGPDACGNSNTATVTVTIIPGPEAGENGILNGCSNGVPVDLFLSLGGTPDSGGTWSPALASGTGVFDPAVDAPGVYTYTVGPDSCGSTDTAEVAVVIVEAPDIDGMSISVDAVTCFGLPVFVELTNALNLSNGNYTVSYTLSGANAFSESLSLNFTGGTSIFEVPETALVNPGETTISITGIETDNGLCSTNTSGNPAASFILEAPEAPDLSSTEIELCEEDEPTVADLDSLYAGSDVLLWYDDPSATNALDPDTALEDDSIYYATSLSSNGCESSNRTSVLVSVIICDTTIVIPDGFSPNDDTINDTFEIPRLRDLYPDFRIYIYNRYGNVVYKGDLNTSDWDGRSNQGGLGSGILPVGVYFYVLEFNDGEKEAVQGRVYLNR
jgi:gliding motility-associated-like protein